MLALQLLCFDSRLSADRCIDCIQNPMLSLDVRTLLESCNFQPCSHGALSVPHQSHHMATHSQSFWPYSCQCALATRSVLLPSLVFLESLPCCYLRRRRGLMPTPNNSIHESFQSAHARELKKRIISSPCLRSSAFLSPIASSGLSIC